MLTSDAARKAIAASMPEYAAEPVDLHAAGGRVLRQLVHAERDQPPFDRVTMDGIAIDYSHFAAGHRAFPIASTQHAGDPMIPLRSAEHCAEVMTGTALPDGADTVIPVERITVADGNAELDSDYEPVAGQFVHRQGSDHRQGVNVLRPGTVISASEVAILASCGLATVEVSQAAKIRVISTGNELIPAGQRIEAHQIRMSNGPALLTMLRRQGFNDSEHDHLNDDPRSLEKRINAHLDAADVLVLSGGVSMGKADHVPQVLDRLGVKKVFHKISQRPGKPMWFGIAPQGQAVFALPGNPVSSLVCCRQYVLPALFASCVRSEPEPLYAALGEPFSFNPSLTCFLPVTVRSDSSGLLMRYAGGDEYVWRFYGAGRHRWLCRTAADRQDFAAGLAVPLHAGRLPSRGFADPCRVSAAPR